MEVIEKENWDWTLISKNKEFILEVAMGTAGGIYVKEIKLGDKQIEEYKKSGTAYIKKLVAIYRQ